MGDTDADPTLGNSQGSVAGLREAGEESDEMEVPSNDELKNKSRKRVYPIPGSTMKVTGHGTKACYPFSSKLRQWSS